MVAAGSAVGAGALAARAAVEACLREWLEAAVAAVDEVAGAMEAAAVVTARADAVLAVVVVRGVEAMAAEATVAATMAAEMVVVVMAGVEEAERGAEAAVPTAAVAKARVDSGSAAVVALERGAAQMAAALMERRSGVEARVAVKVVEVMAAKVAREMEVAERVRQGLEASRAGECGRRWWRRQ